MALTEGDKNTCKELAREIIKEVLAEHIKSCPHGLVLAKSRAMLVGLCIGSGLAGGGGALALAQIVMRIFS